jgi:hypothetical protein
MRDFHRAVMSSIMAFGLAAIYSNGAFAREEAQASVPQAHADAPLRPFWSKRETGYLTTRDGTKLAYTVLLPDGSGPFPVVLNYTGYDPQALGGPAYLRGDAAMSINLDKELLAKGFAIAGLNARGTGCSEGIFDFSDINFGPDGSDAVEFLAKRPWSNGKVGMNQLSWAGLSQLLTAAERPPHLVAIAPGMVSADTRDSGAPGGVPQPMMRLGWWQFVSTRWANVAEDAKVRNDQQCIAQVAANRQNANRQSPTTIAFMHPFRDDYTERRNVLLRAANIEVPVLSVTAFQDQVVTSRNGHYLDAIDPKRLWVVGTNGPHDMYHAPSIRAKIVRFFEHLMQGKANGFDREPRTELHLESSSTAHGFAVGDEAKPGFVLALPQYPVAVDTRRFVLGSGQAMVEGGIADGAPDAFQSPFAAPTVNADIMGDSWGPLPDGYEKGRAVFTSPPLQAPLVTTGSGSANLWISSTGPDADVQVTLTEVRADGQEIYVQRGWLRLSNRALDAGRSTELQPHLYDRAETLIALKPGEPVLGSVELPNFSHAFRAGSRIRIWIDNPSTTGFLGFSPFSMPATVKVWHDPDHVSYLALGAVRGVKVPHRPFPCGTVLKQPCRVDPLAEPK